MCEAVCGVCGVHTGVWGLCVSVCFFFFGGMQLYTPEAKAVENPSPVLPRGLGCGGIARSPKTGSRVAASSRLSREWTQAGLLSSVAFCCVTSGQSVGLSGPCFCICQRNMMTLLTLKSWGWGAREFMDVEVVRSCWLPEHLRPLHQVCAFLLQWVGSYCFPNRVYII